MVKRLLCAILAVLYVILALWGFLSGMLGEGLIGSAHPMAGLLADAMLWLGLAISLAAVVCPLISLGMKKRPILQRVMLTLPFLLMAVQMVLTAVAEKMA